jgi:hypothetical protein
MEMAMDSRAAIQMLKFGRIWKKIRSAWCHLTIRVNSFRLIQQPDPNNIENVSKKEKKNYGRSEDDYF